MNIIKNDIELSNFGFKIFSKKVELLKIYKTITGKNDWIDWYRKQYKKDPIKLKFPKAELIEIITLYDIRLKRTSVKDIEKDKKRIEYWHSDNNCLLTNVS